jgi:hypothetical protein
MGGEGVEMIYHFTDTMRLPWIIETGELRVGLNRVSKLPFEFLWATTNPNGDRSCSAQGAMARETYRLGRMCLVRFTLPGDSFLNWSNVPRLYPEWTADQIARTQKAAVENGEAGFNNWRVRMEPLQISQALAVEAKSYTSGRWVPIDATMKSCILLADIENGRGVTIGEYVYLSAQDHRCEWSGWLHQSRTRDPG